MQPNQVPNPNLIPPAGEQHPVQPGVERPVVPAAPEVAPAGPPAAPSPQPAPVIPVPAFDPQPPVPAADPALPAPPPPAAPNPVAADDVDVIEKAWVDQANSIVKQTKDDPYVEEEAVESLQQDYLKKRYGHDVGKPDGS